MGHMPQSFFWRAINLPSYTITLTGTERSPLRSRFTKSISESFSLSSACHTASLRCDAVKPSGPVAETAGNVLRHLMTSSEETWSGWNLRFPVNEEAGLRSACAGGCLDPRDFKVSVFVGAGTSSEHSRRTAARKFPASSLFLIAAARRASWSLDHYLIIIIIIIIILNKLNMQNFLTATFCVYNI